jgi:hypothetical protein
MGNSKSTRMTAAEIGLTPHEERLLKSYFSRRTRPYLVALGLLVCALGAILSAGVPDAGSDSQGAAQRAEELQSASEALRGQLEAEIAALRGELGGLSQALQDQESKPQGGTDSGARKRLDQVDSSIRKLGKRIDEMEARAVAAETRLLGFEGRLGVEDSLPGAPPEAEAPDPGDSTGMAFE